MNLLKMYHNRWNQPVNEFKVTDKTSLDWSLTCVQSGSAELNLLEPSSSFKL